MIDERPKRVFSKKGGKTTPRSLRCPDDMWELLNDWAIENDETANKWIVLLLDGLLQQRAKTGSISLPIDQKQNNKKVKRIS